jgi:predicted lipoprotein
MMLWQELEVMQIGPKASSLTAVGGEDLRDEIYSWPTVNPCRIDQVVANGEWLADDFFELNLVNAYGLGGVEQALFGADENVCPSQIDINANGTWDALGPAGVAANRAAYAGAMAAEARALTATLLEAWAPGGGDWSGAMSAGAAGPYGGDAAALNAVFDALFYLEIRTKDRKLAMPLGLRDCVEAACPEAVEALPSGASRAAIAANLRGFRRLFTGEAGAGMDDLLAERGEGALSDELLTRLDAAIALTESDETPIDAALATDRASVEALHDAVKGVADLLKGDVATVLTLTVPAEAAGDND